MDCLVSVQILLQAEPAFVNFLCCLQAYITVVPHFLGNPCNIFLIGGTAENKTVLVTVLLQPRIDIIRIAIDIYGKPQFMFAGSGYGHPLLCQFLSILP